MKKISLTIKTLLFLFITISVITSCRKNFEIEEIDKFKDSIVIDGSVAAPLINAKLSISDFNLDEEGSEDFWFEIDDNDLIHIRIKSELGETTFGTISPIVPVDAGYSLTENSTRISTEIMELPDIDFEIDGEYYIADPRINVLIRNQIGLNLYFTIHEFSFYDENDNPTGSITNSPLNQQQDLAYPTVSGEEAKDTIKINKTTAPDFPNLISTIPKAYSMDVAIGFPAQSVPFTHDGSEKVYYDIDVDLPIDLWLKDFTIRDTVDFDLTEDTYEQVQRVLLKMKVDNGFPFGIKLQAYFLSENADGSLTQIDQLFDAGKEWDLVAAETNSNGEVNKATESLLEVEVDQEKFNNLKNKEVTKMIFDAKLTTFNADQEQSIKILSSYEIGVKVSAKLDYSASNSDF